MIVSVIFVRGCHFSMVVVFGSVVLGWCFVVIRSPFVVRSSVRSSVHPSVRSLSVRSWRSWNASLSGRVLVPCVKEVIDEVLVAVVERIYSSSLQSAGGAASSK